MWAIKTYPAALAVMNPARVARIQNCTPTGESWPTWNVPLWNGHFPRSNRRRTIPQDVPREVIVVKSAPLDPCEGCGAPALSRDPSCEYCGRMR